MSSDHHHLSGRDLRRWADRPITDTATDAERFAIAAARELLIARARLTTPPHQPADLEEHLEDLWDAGNATGLDGWTGPARGAADIDAYAVSRRERAVHTTMEKLGSAPRPSAGYVLGCHTGNGWAFARLYGGPLTRAEAETELAERDHPPGHPDHLDLDWALLDFRVVPTTL